MKILFFIFYTNCTNQQNNLVVEERTDLFTCNPNYLKPEEKEVFFSEKKSSDSFRLKKKLFVDFFYEHKKSLIFFSCIFFLLFLIICFRNFFLLFFAKILKKSIFNKVKATTNTVVPEQKEKKPDDLENNQKLVEQSFDFEKQKLILCEKPYLETTRKQLFFSSDQNQAPEISSEYFIEPQIQPTTNPEIIGERKHYCSYFFDCSPTPDLSLGVTSFHQSDNNPLIIEEYRGFENKYVLIPKNRDQIYGDALYYNKSQFVEHMPIMTAPLLYKPHKLELFSPVYKTIGPYFSNHFQATKYPTIIKQYNPFFSYQNYTNGTWDIDSNLKNLFFEYYLKNPIATKQSSSFLPMNMDIILSLDNRVKLFSQMSPYLENETCYWNGFQSIKYPKMVQHIFLPPSLNHRIFDPNMSLLGIQEYSGSVLKSKKKKINEYKMLGPGLYEQNINLEPKKRPSQKKSLRFNFFDKNVQFNTKTIKCEGNLNKSVAQDVNTNLSEEDNQDMSTTASLIGEDFSGEKPPKIKEKNPSLSMRIKPLTPIPTENLKRRRKSADLGTKKGNKNFPQDNDQKADEDYVKTEQLDPRLFGVDSCEKELVLSQNPPAELREISLEKEVEESVKSLYPNIIQEQPSGIGEEKIKIYYLFLREKIEKIKNLKQKIDSLIEIINQDEVMREVLPLLKKIRKKTEIDMFLLWFEKNDEKITQKEKEKLLVFFQKIKEAAKKAIISIKKPEEKAIYFKFWSKKVEKISEEEEDKLIEEAINQSLDFLINIVDILNSNLEYILQISELTNLKANIFDYVKKKLVYFLEFIEKRENHIETGTVLILLQKIHQSISKNQKDLFFSFLEILEENIDSNFFEKIFRFFITLKKIITPENINIILAYIKEHFGHSENSQAKPMNHNTQAAQKKLKGFLFLYLNKVGTLLWEEIKSNLPEMNEILEAIREVFLYVCSGIKSNQIKLGFYFLERLTINIATELNKNDAKNIFSLVGLLDYITEENVMCFFKKVIISDQNQENQSLFVSTFKTMKSLKSYVTAAVKSTWFLATTFRKIFSSMCFAYKDLEDKKKNIRKSLFKKDMPEIGDLFFINTDQKICFELTGYMRYEPVEYLDYFSFLLKEYPQLFDNYDYIIPLNGGLKAQFVDKEIIQLCCQDKQMTMDKPLFYSPNIKVKLFLGQEEPETRETITSGDFQKTIKEEKFPLNDALYNLVTYGQSNSKYYVDENEEIYLRGVYGPNEKLIIYWDPILDLLNSFLKTVNIYLKATIKIENDSVEEEGVFLTGLRTITNQIETIKNEYNVTGLDLPVNLIAHFLESLKTTITKETTEEELKKAKIESLYFFYGNDIILCFRGALSISEFFKNLNLDQNNSEDFLSLWKKTQTEKILNIEIEKDKKMSAGEICSLMKECCYSEADLRMLFKRPGKIYFAKKTNEDKFCFLLENSEGKFKIWNKHDYLLDLLLKDVEIKEEGTFVDVGECKFLVVLLEEKTLIEIKEKFIFTEEGYYNQESFRKTKYSSETEKAFQIGISKTTQRKQNLFLQENKTPSLREFFHANINFYTSNLCEYQLVYEINKDKRFELYFQDGAHKEVLESYLCNVFNFVLDSMSKIGKEITITQTGNSLGLQKANIQDLIFYTESGFLDYSGKVQLESFLAKDFQQLDQEKKEIFFEYCKKEQEKRIQKISQQQNFQSTMTLGNLCDNMNSFFFIKHELFYFYEKYKRKEYFFPIEEGCFYWKKKNLSFDIKKITEKNKYNNLINFLRRIKKNYREKYILYEPCDDNQVMIDLKMIDKKLKNAYLMFKKEKILYFTKDEEIKITKLNFLDYMNEINSEIKEKEDFISFVTFFFKKQEKRTKDKMTFMKLIMEYPPIDEIKAFKMLSLENN